MKYVSTRGSAPALGFSDVLLAGLARDGGLYVPLVWLAIMSIALAPWVGKLTDAVHPAKITAFGFGERPPVDLPSDEVLVSRRRDGNHVYYALADRHVAELLQNALDHACELDGAAEPEEED